VKKTPVLATWIDEPRIDVTVVTLYHRCLTVPKTGVPPWSYQ